eukprot:1136828-Pelagomonas_calceolata.AAC.1
MVNTKDERTLIHHQVQCQTHFAPVIIKKWALPIFMKAGLQPATTLIAACTVMLSVLSAKLVITLLAMNLSTLNLRILICIFVMSANLHATGNAWKNLVYTLMGRDKILMQLTHGLVPPVHASMRHRKLTDNVSPEKNL